MNPSVRAILLSSRQQRVPPEFSSLFLGSEPGLIFLPSLRRSLFQDSAMTIPASVGSPVVKMLDMSGRGNTATLTNVTLQADGSGKMYLSANGTSSSGITSAIDFTSTDKATIWVGVHKNSDAGTQTVYELSTTDTNAGMFFLRAPTGAAANYQSKVRGATAAGTVTPVATAPDTSVLSVAYDIATNGHSVRRNGGAALTNAAALGGGNFGNYALNLFNRSGGSLFFDGRLYGLVIRGATSSAGQISDGETAMNRLTGAY